ncbi:MAG: PepSY domain-containing protein, partial [Vicinamibacterales bacterium]
MKSFRTVLFWGHLAAGATAGIVILIMSVTGVALTYEKQMLEWADRQAASVVPGFAHLPPEELLANAAPAMPGKAPIGLTLRADATAPATITFEGNAALLVNPYTG